MKIGVVVFFAVGIVFGSGDVGGMRSEFFNFHVISWNKCDSKRVMQGHSKSVMQGHAGLWGAYVGPFVGPCGGHVGPCWAMQGGIWGPCWTWSGRVM